MLFYERSKFTDHQMRILIAFRQIKIKKVVVIKGEVYEFFKLYLKVLFFCVLLICYKNYKSEQNVFLEETEIPLGSTNISNKNNISYLPEDKSKSKIAIINNQKYKIVFEKDTKRYLVYGRFNKSIGYIQEDEIYIYDISDKNFLSYLKPLK